MLKTQSKVEDIELKVAQLPRLEEQAKQFIALGLEDKLKLIPLLEREKNLGHRISQELVRVEELLQKLHEYLPDLDFSE